MDARFRIIFFCCLVIMRGCSKAINKDGQKNEYCWLDNAIGDLERSIKEKL